MQRHEQVIQLSNHIKNKLKQHQHSSFNNSSDESIETIGTNDDNDSERLNRTRRNTFTTHQAEQSFFTDRKTNNPPTVSILLERYSKQQCRKCLHRNDIEHQNLENENRKLREQLRASIFLNRQYEEENAKLKHYLRKLNSNLNEYEINFNQLKQKQLSEKKISPKLSEEDEQDHLKRLRYEVQMYNRIVAAKQQQQEKQNEQKQVDFFF